MQEAAFRPGMNGKHRKYDIREQYQVRLFRPPRPPSSAASVASSKVGNTSTCPRSANNLTLLYFTLPPRKAYDLLTLTSVTSLA